jgi:ribosomal protein L11
MLPSGKPQQQGFGPALGPWALRSAEIAEKPKVRTEPRKSVAVCCVIRITPRRIISFGIDD